MNHVDQIRKYWDSHAERDPLWAVLSEATKSGGRWDVERFFETGVSEIASVFYQLDSRRIDVARGSALDFGCGVGRLTQALAPSFDRVVGVDISTRMLALAEDFNAFPSRVSYVANPHEDLHVFDDRSFDFIISNIVLQHVPPALALTYVGEFFRLLRRGGILVFQLPAHRRTDDDAAPPASPTAMADDAYQATISAIGVDALALAPGAEITLPVAITNISGVDWHAEHAGVMRAGNHWLDASGDRMLNRDDGRSSLPRVVKSGATCHVQVTITAPPEAGDYQCAIDIAHEGVLWFHDKGSALLRFPVRVGRVGHSNEGPQPTADARGREPERSVERSSTALLHRVNLANPDPGDFPMHGVDRAQVLDLIARHHGTLLHIEDDTGAGTDWISFRYYARQS